MSRKIRKQIYVEPYQESALKRFAERTGLSEAEVIRQAINQHIHSPQPVAPDREAWEREKKFIEDLIAKGPVPGGRTWRRDDAYDRVERYVR